LTFALFSYSMAGAEEPQFDNWGSMFALSRRGAARPPGARQAHTCPSS
jgi:hypothetical protein